MSECVAVRRLLALRPADRSESERTLVEAHLAGCPACAAVARAYAEQDRLPQAGPRVALTPAQRRGLFGRLERLRRGQRTRARLSWALGVPLGIIAVLALVVAVSYLLGSRQAPASTGQISPTAISSSSASPLALSPTATPLRVFPTSTGPYVTVRFACYSFQQEAFAPLVAEFQAQNPDVRIEFVALDDITEDYENLTLNVVSAADTAYFMVEPAAVSQGLLYDLTPFIAADESFAPEDFFPGTLEAFQWDNRTWALPSGAWMTFLYYDKPMFDAAGLSYPTLAWTRDDFLTAAQQLTLRQGQEITQYGFVDYAQQAARALVLPAVGDYRQLGNELSLDDPAVVAAVRWYVDLAQHYQVMPLQSGQGGTDQERALIESGQAAMWSDDLLNQSNYRDYLSRDVGLAPIPSAAGPVVPAHMYGYFMSPGTEHPEESWRWLRFLSGRRLLLEHDALAEVLPARCSVAEQSGYWDQFDAETVDVVHYASEHLFFPSLNEAERFLSYALYYIAQEGRSVEDALAEAQATLVAQQAQATQATPIPVVIATPQPASPTDAVVVTFALPPVSSNEGYQALAAAFNQAYTDVQVQLLPPDQDAQADCFAGARSVDYAEHRAGLLDLQPLLDADPTFTLDDFYPRFLDALRYEGDLWGLPTQAQVQVVFYNQDLFDAAGVPYPQPGWDLDDFLSTAISLTQGEGDTKQYGFLPVNGDVTDLRTFLALRGAVLWDEEGQPRFDAPDVAAAVQWYADLALLYGVMPAFPDDLPDSSVQAWRERSSMVRAGRVAMWADFTGLDRSSDWPVGADVGMAPLPLYGGQGVTEFLSQGLFISAASPHPQACWKWFQYISVRPEIVQNLPARRSIADSAVFAEQVGPEAAASFQATLSYADVPLSFTPEQATQLRWLYQALADIFRGTPVEEALAAAQREAIR